MSQRNGYADGNSITLGSGAMNDLVRVAEAMESLEIRLSILSVQMKYEESPFSGRAVELTREIGEIHTLLENVLAFGT